MLSFPRAAFLKTANLRGEFSETTGICSGPFEKPCTLSYDLAAAIKNTASVSGVRLTFPDVE